MKHLMTLMALAFAFAAGAQGTSIHEYPWNPDSNNDTYIGAEDLMGLLSTYGTQFGLPPEPCTYDGTPLEEWWGQAISGDIIVDSIFFELLLIDSALVYYPGCPEAVLDTVEFAWNEMVTDVQLGTSPYSKPSLNCYSNDMYWIFEFDGSDGGYKAITLFPLLAQLGFSGDGFFGGYGGSWRLSEVNVLPFPEYWLMDEDGIHLDSGWGSNSWPYYANYLHILPYWHYAE